MDILFSDEIEKYILKDPHQFLLIQLMVFIYLNYDLLLNNI